MNEEEATYALKTMIYIRRMENKAAELYRLRLINGFLHLYSGQVEFTISRINRTSRHRESDDNRKKKGEESEREEREEPSVKKRTMYLRRKQ